MTRRTTPEPVPLSVRGYARHRRALGLPGGDESTCRRAVRDGRVPRGLVSADGKILDPEAADRAWEASTRSQYAPRSGRTAPKAKAPGPVLVVDLDAVSVRFPLVDFLAGAAAALREAGRQPTEEALRQVVEGVDAETWWTLCIDDVNGRIDPSIPLPELAAAWERAGWEAAGGP